MKKPKTRIGLHKHIWVLAESKDRYHLAVEFCAYPDCLAWNPRKDLW